MVATTPGDSVAWAGRARRAALVAVLLILAAIIVAFVRTVFGSWHATGDQALIELRVLDVGGRHTPLVGPYSRYGWSHPGPALFYALVPMLRVFGGHDIGLLAGALSINALALAAMFAIVWRRRDPAAWILVGLVAVLLIRSPGAVALFEPWNPYLIVLPLLATAVSAWTAAGGSRWSLVATVVLASFVAQSHIGAALPAVALVGFAFAWAAVGARRASGGDRQRRIGSIAIALAVGLVAWIPPIAQAATSSGGNLREIWEFWTSSHAVSGFAQGARFVSPQFAIPAPWMGAHEHTGLGGALLPSANRFPVALILLAAVTFGAARRRDRDAIALCSLAWVLALTTWIAASRIVDVPFPYLLRWAWVAGAVAWLAIAWTGWQMIPARLSRLRDATLLTAALGACIIGVLVVVSAARTPYPVPIESHTLDEIREPVLAALRGAPGPILIDTGSSLPVANVAAGLFLEATRAGLPVRVPASIGYRVDASRALRGRPGSVLLVVTDAAADPRLRDHAYRLVASYDALHPADRARLTRFLDEVDGHLERLAELERDHPSEYSRLQGLKRRDVRVAVFLRTG